MDIGLSKDLEKFLVKYRRKAKRIKTVAKGLRSREGGAERLK